MGKTLFDKVWDAHVVRQLDGGRSVLYIDRHYIHEVTSPVAFLGLKNRGIKVARPQQTTGTPDHNVPTLNQDRPVAEEQSRKQLESFSRNCEENGVEYFKLGSPGHGVVHIVGPEQGITQPGMTIVCGDSHTSTHGAFGAVAFGIGTSEVEMVFASQCILQPKPKTMRITVNGKRGKGVTAKDIVLYIISKISASGGTGHFIEFAGEAIRDLSMEERMTVCNMSIECGARGGIIATTNVLPKVWVQLYEYAKSGQEAKANKLLLEYLPLFKALFKEANPGSIKYAMRRLGLNGGYACTPIPAEPTEETRNLIDKLLAEKGLL